MFEPKQCSPRPSGCVCLPFMKAPEWASSWSPPKKSLRVLHEVHPIPPTQMSLRPPTHGPCHLHEASNARGQGSYMKRLPNARDPKCPTWSTPNARGTETPPRDPEASTWSSLRGPTHQTCIFVDNSWLVLLKIHEYWTVGGEYTSLSQDETYSLTNVRFVMFEELSFLSFYSLDFGCVGVWASIPTLSPFQAPSTGFSENSSKMLRFVQYWLQNFPTPKLCSEVKLKPERCFPLIFTIVSKWNQ